MQKIRYHVYLKRRKLWLNQDMYAQKEVCIQTEEVYIKTMN